MVHFGSNPFWLKGLKRSNLAKLTVFSARLRMFHKVTVSLAMQGVSYRCPMWPLSPNALSVFFLKNSQQHLTIIYPNLHSGHVKTRQIVPPFFLTLNPKKQHSHGSIPPKSQGIRRRFLACFVKWWCFFLVQCPVSRHILAIVGGFKKHINQKYDSNWIKLDWDFCLSAHNSDLQKRVNFWVGHKPSRSAFFTGKGRAS